MRKTIKMRGLICLLAAVLFAVLLAGCGAESEPSKQEVTPAEEAQQPAKVETSAPAVPAISAGGEVETLIAKSKKFDSMSFEYVIEDVYASAEGKVWTKGSKSKNEITMDGQTMIIIVDFATDEAIVYYPQDNIATLEDLVPDMVGWYENPTNYYEDLDIANVKMVGSETVDGYKCKIMTVSNDKGEVENKVWISEEYGIPLRIEAYYEDGVAGTLEYKNLKVEPVSEAEFKLPDNVEVMDRRDS